MTDLSEQNSAEDECPREDCQRIAATASEVYCDITGGKLSYPTYDARTILAYANDETQKLVDEECERARAEERQRFHVPEIAEHRDGWGVFCAACSAGVGDYVYPCKVTRGDSWQRIPRMLVPGGQVDKP